MRWRGGRGKLKAKGLTSPYLKTVRRLARELHALLEGDVVRLRRGARQDHASAQKFNVDRIKQEDVAKAGGGPPDEE